MEREIKLQKRYGILHGVGVISGLVFGSGIYVAPSGILRYIGSGSVALIIWFISGIISFIGALCYAELGTTIPTSGEKYAYLRQMYGPKTGFVYAWTYILLFRPGANAIKCITFSKYVLEPLFDCDNLPGAAEVLLAVVFCWFLVIINCFYVKWSARGQTCFTLCGVAALISIIITSFVHLASNGGELNDPDFGFESASPTIGNIVLGFYSTFWAYGGYQALNFIVDEIENPARNLPIAIGISAMISMLIYTIINFAFITVLGTKVVANSLAVGTIFARKTWGSWWFVISICISVNLAGSFNSGLVIASRIFYESGKRGDLGSVFSLISVKFLSPIISIITEGLLITCAIFVRDIYYLLNLCVFFNQASTALVFLGLIRMRFTRPHQNRPFKLPLAFLIFFVSILLIMIFVTAYENPLTTILGLTIFITTGLAYYYIFISWKSKPEYFFNFRRKITITLQKIFYATIEDAKNL